MPVPGRYHLLACVGLVMWAAAPAAPAGAQELTDSRRIAVARRLQDASVSVRVGRNGHGSGFVVGSEKWVVTNAHVVRHFRRAPIAVRLGDGQERRARVLSYDPHHDLAVLEVEGEVDLEPLPIGDSDEVEVGQTVLAFGSPFGLDGTLTQGIVSARRDFPAIGGGRVRQLIQTDAPINPGNSGGPLVDTRGRVVGVNTAIFSRSGGSHGIGFAVPSSYVEALLDEVRKEIRQRSVRAERPRGSGDAADGGARGWLGACLADFRWRGVRGARILRVAPGSPAAEAGLRGELNRPPSVVRSFGGPWYGYVILQLDDEPVHGAAHLVRLLAGQAPGDVVKLHVAVPGTPLQGEVEVRLAPRRDGQAPPCGPSGADHGAP